MAAKIVALGVVALALANAAPRDVSKLDNQLLEDKISEILSSSELMQSAQESPDWMVAARRSNSSSYQLVQRVTFSGAITNTPYTGTVKTNVEVGYAKYIGIYSGSSYSSGCSLSSGTITRRAATVEFTSVVTNALVDSVTSAANGVVSDTSGLQTSIVNEGVSVTVDSATGATVTTISTSGVAQLTFSFAALLAALFAHLF